MFCGTSCQQLCQPAGSKYTPLSLCNSLSPVAGCQQVKQNMRVAYHWGCNQRCVLVIQSLADLDAISFSSQYHVTQQSPVGQ